MVLILLKTQNNYTIKVFIDYDIYVIINFFTSHALLKNTDSFCTKTENLFFLTFFMLRLTRLFHLRHSETDVVLTWLFYGIFGRRFNDAIILHPCVMCYFTTVLLWMKCINYFWVILSTGFMNTLDFIHLFAWYCWWMSVSKHIFSTVKFIFFKSIKSVFIFWYNWNVRYTASIMMSPLILTVYMSQILFILFGSFSFL